MNKVKQRPPFIMGLVRFFARPFIRLMMKIKVVGLENIPKEGAALLAANHFSWWEPPSMIVSCRRPIYFIAANDFRWDWRISWIVRLYGTIPVDRTRFEKKTIALALKKLREGRLVGIFPQGGMQQTVITDAKPGVMYIAHRSAVPVIPVGISGQINPSSSWMRLRRPSVTVRIGKPYQLPALSETWAEQKKQMTDSGNDLMAHIAALVDPAHRGHFAEHPLTIALSKEYF